MNTDKTRILSGFSQTKSVEISVNPGLQKAIRPFYIMGQKSVEVLDVQ